MPPHLLFLDGTSGNKKYILLCRSMAFFWSRLNQHSNLGFVNLEKIWNVVLICNLNTDLWTPNRMCSNSRNMDQLFSAFLCKVVLWFNLTKLSQANHKYPSVFAGAISWVAWRPNITGSAVFFAHIIFSFITGAASIAKLFRIFSRTQLSYTYLTFPALYVY